MANIGRTTCVLRTQGLLGTLLVVAGLTAIPARIGARTPAPQILQSEA